MDEPEIAENDTSQTQHTPWFKRRWFLWSAPFVFLILIMIVVMMATGGRHEYRQPVFTYSDGKRQINESDAIKAGKVLSHNQCKDEGVPSKLSSSPMRPDDFTIAVPYGLMVGAHVTPIDHQYFSPKSYQSKPDAYEVRAMGDAHLVDITSRERPFGKEYRFVFAVSCTFLYYYDLVTSLAPDIKSTYNKQGQRVNIPVKSGQVIGRIGGQTLDFAVWDTTKPLSGFVVPDHYKGESWKIFTADPLNYYTDDLKSFILSRYVRTAEPISGKIDHDIDGKLIGNWFLEGTDGYSGNQNNHNNYWTSHLSFSPNLYDPAIFIVSIGDWVGRDGPGSQFMAVGNTPNPKDVTIDTGLVKYELAGQNYIKGDGQSWDQNSIATGISVEPSQERAGCALVRMIESRKIKFESFPHKPCTDISDFSPAAKIYTR